MKSESDVASKKMAVVQRLQIQASCMFLKPCGISLCTFGYALMYLNMKSALLAFPIATATRAQTAKTIRL